VDHALADGAVVPPHYDSMIGKLIAHAATRTEAIDRLSSALAQTIVLGLPSNRGVLMQCLLDPVFRAGEALIPFLAERGDGLRASLAAREDALLPLLFAAAWCAQAPAGPRSLAVPFARAMRLRHRDRIVEASVLEHAPHELQVTLGERTTRLQVAHEPLRLMVDGLVHALAVACHGAARWHVQVGDTDAWIADASFDPPEGPRAGTACDIKAPFSGRVVALHACAGQRVARGDTLLVIESMKLEHAVSAPGDATIASVAVEIGQQVSPQQLLACLDSEGTIP